ncbi:hypothetical protein [Sphaerimonospora thailandensis]|uniref:Uncharacterized protein n=1 Tax=Sphaerimonospora thailandensis TaxID=795644 RepID=A0A8J3VYZ2_9ACTN|nr:hypothetical protein [Sphaerimonospora thailandensis]GIH69992.1 hypothetical protein Mth01_22450 [Sphaerimonospora thailandensis]
MTEIGDAGPERSPLGGDIDPAMSPIGRLGDTPVAGHVAIFEEVLTGLETVLASVDDQAPDPTADVLP